MRKVPVEKNKTYEIEITGMGYSGEGVGRIENFTVFIPGSIKSEKVQAKISEVKKNFARAKLLKVIEPSPLRVVPMCSAYESCGGCQIQHISYGGQLEFKKQRVVDNIERIGKIDGSIVKDVIGMKNPERYRNKVQLPVGGTCKDPRIGFYAAGTHDIADINECIIEHEEADKIIGIVRDWIKKYKIEPYDEASGCGTLRHIMVRKGFKTGDIMVVIVTKTNDVKHMDALCDELLSSIKNIKSIVQNINPDKTNVVLGRNNNVLYGSGNITDYVGPFKFNISPLSFFQVNPVQTEVLYNKVMDFAGLTGNETVFDAYCGTGTISLFLSQKAKKVYGVEIVEDAIKNAKVNASVNNVHNVEFICGESEKVIPDMIENGIKADVVVVDPPRKGCAEELLSAISSMQPSRIVYVSCDPGTLSRDLAFLESHGYKTIEVQPVDMFPNTAHVECVAMILKV